MKSKYNIVTLPSKVLLGEMKKIEKFDEHLKKLAKDMEVRMYESNGVGLAASQIGLPLKMFVIAHGKTSKAFINPEIYDVSGPFEIEEEGCLSIPGQFMPIKRYRQLKMRYFDQFGVLHDITAKGFFARVIQHEYDHIFGTLINARTTELTKEERKKFADA